MKLADIPATSARDFLRGVLDRNRPRGDVLAWRVTIHLGVEGSRVIWAISRYLEVHETRGVGIEETDFSLAHVRKYFGALLEQLKSLSDDEKMMELKPRDLLVLADAERQLDRYCIMNAPGWSMNKSTGGKRK